MDQNEIQQEPQDSTVDTGFNSKFNPKDMPVRTRYEVIDIDPTKAKEFLEINVYETQRQEKPLRLAELKRKFLDNRFHGGEIAVANLSFPYPVEFVNDDGTTFLKEFTRLLMNGQHVLKIIKETGKSQLTTYKEFDIRYPEQLAVLFAQFDCPGGIRSTSQVINGYMEIPEIKTLGWTSSSAITDITGVVGWLEKDIVNRQEITIEERINLTLSPKYLPSAKWIYDTVYREKNINVGHIKRQPVICVMMENYKKNLEKAEEFWRQVKTGELIPMTSPAYVLRDKLKNIVIGHAGRLKDNGKERISTEDVIEYCKIAFQAFLDNKQISRLKLKSKKKKT